MAPISGLRTTECSGKGREVAAPTARRVVGLTINFKLDCGDGKDCKSRAYPPDTSTTGRAILWHGAGARGGTPYQHYPAYYRRGRDRHRRGLGAAQGDERLLRSDRALFCRSQPL